MARIEEGLGSFYSANKAKKAERQKEETHNEEPTTETARAPALAGHSDKEFARVNSVMDESPAAEV